jgi:prepilin-type N-terminal cleavage/methylation domain-containing protein
MTLRLRTFSGARPPRGFTLIELLVVVGIITLLLGLVLPALASARTRRMMLLAHQEVKTIAGACTAYYEALNEYPPDTNQYGTGDVPETHTDPASIIKYLGRKVTDVRTNKEYGPFFIAKKKYTVGSNSEPIYIDPWGSPYHLDALHVQIDSSDTGTAGDVLRVGVPYPPGTEEEKQRVEIKIWSDGPDQKHADGSNVSDGKGTGDDYDNVTSWAD